MPWLGDTCAITRMHVDTARAYISTQTRTLTHSHTHMCQRCEFCIGGLGKVDAREVAMQLLHASVGNGQLRMRWQLALPSDMGPPQLCYDQNQLSRTIGQMRRSTRHNGLLDKQRMWSTVRVVAQSSSMAQEALSTWAICRLALLDVPCDSVWVVSKRQ